MLALPKRDVAAEADDEMRHREQIVGLGKRAPDDPYMELYALEFFGPSATMSSMTATGSGNQQTQSPTTTSKPSLSSGACGTEIGGVKTACLYSRVEL